jgi:hypothetical protein
LLAGGGVGYDQAMRSPGVIAAVLLASALTSVAAAQEEEEKLVVTRPGQYQGVTPGRRRDGPPPPPKKRPGRPTITWIGFQVMEAGSARVFLQSSHSFRYDQRVQGGELVVTLSEVRLGNYNFQRFMDTSFFDAPTKVIKASPMRKNGVELHIKFKGEARQADARMEQGQDGYHYLYLDFGAAGGS